jgi:hypothetical protein
MCSAFTPISSALARRPEFLALSEIGGEGHHLAIVGHLQPLEDDGGVKAAGIGKDDALDIGHDRRFP